MKLQVSKSTTLGTVVLLGLQSLCAGNPIPEHRNGKPRDLIESSAPFHHTVDSISRDYSDPSIIEINAVDSSLPGILARAPPAPPSRPGSPGSKGSPSKVPSQDKPPAQAKPPGQKSTSEKGSPANPGKKKSPGLTPNRPPPPPPPARPGTNPGGPGLTPNRPPPPRPPPGKKPNTNNPAEDNTAPTEAEAAAFKISEEAGTKALNLYNQVRRSGTPDTTVVESPDLVDASNTKFFNVFKNTAVTISEKKSQDLPAVEEQALDSIRNSFRVALLKSQAVETQVNDPSGINKIALRGHFSKSGEYIIIWDNFSKNNAPEKGHPERVPVNEMTYQVFRKAAGANIKNLKTLLIRNDSNSDDLNTMRAAYKLAKKTIGENVEFLPSSPAFKALLGLANVRGKLQMLSNHHTEFGSKEISKIVVLTDTAVATVFSVALIF